MPAILRPNRFLTWEVDHSQHQLARRVNPLFPPMLQALATLALAFFKAIPALEALFARFQDEMARQREATAAQRRAEKDAAVDEAIDRP
jgi:hypothetical protein